MYGDLRVSNDSIFISSSSSSYRYTKENHNWHIVNKFSIAPYIIAISQIFTILCSSLTRNTIQKPAKCPDTKKPHDYFYSHYADVDTHDTVRINLKKRM